MPEWYLDEPLVSPGARLVVDSFWELSTERQVGWVPGYIPASRIEARAAQLGLSRGMMALFKAATRAADDEYLASLSKKRGSAKDT